MATVPAPGTTGAPVAARPSLTMEDLIRKEREVANRAADLQRRERDVRLAMQRMQPNWPGRFLCIGPMVYHSIPSEVPADRQKFVTSCYYNYFATIVFILYNLAVAGVAMGATSEKIDGEKDTTPWGTHFGVGFVHLLGIPGAFIAWYFQIYKACSTGIKTKYNLAYVGVSIAFLYDVFMALGFVGYGGCGFIFSMSARSKKSSQTPYIMGLVCAALWALQGIFFIWVFVRLRRYQRQDEQRRVEGVVGAVVNVASSIAGAIVPGAAMAL